MMKSDLIIPYATTICKEGQQIITLGKRPRNSICDLSYPTQKSNSYSKIIYICIFFFFASTGVWTQGLTITRQALYH
jgi:hypothetical protein